VDARLLVRSEVSGALALKTLLVRCATSQKRVLPSELEECQLTQLWVLPEELGTCAATGKRALRTRLVTCQQTGDRVQASEVGQSAVRGKVVWKTLLLASQKPPGRLGLQEEMGLCAATGKQLLIDELGRFHLSGKLVDRELLRVAVTVVTAKNEDYAFDMFEVKLSMNRPAWSPGRRGFGTQHSGVVTRKERVTNDIRKTRKLPSAAPCGNQGCRYSNRAKATMTAPSP
jgi:hypothetical protein